MVADHRQVQVDGGIQVDEAECAVLHTNDVERLEVAVDAALLVQVLQAGG